MKIKYYKKFTTNLDKYQINQYIDHQILVNSSLIIASSDNELKGFIIFQETKDNYQIIKIHYDEDRIKNKSINHFKLMAYLMNKQIIFSSDKIYNLVGFDYDKNSQKYIYCPNPIDFKSVIKIGSLKQGNQNNICDVDGVIVGHSSLISENYHTGVTSINIKNRNLYLEKCPASCYSYNGFGKSMGFIQIEEMGTIETPIILTNTLSIGRVSTGLIEYALRINPEIGITTGTVNPIVLECNDGGINNIRDIVLTEEHVFQALNNASTNFLQGSVGAGSGMKCFNLKGGIGSSSRVFKIDGKEYTIGVILNSNFGSQEELIIKGRHLGNNININNTNTDKGSIVVVIATDLPVDARQLKRIAKRSIIGIGRTGSYSGNGSGDVFVAFSTQNPVSHFSSSATTYYKSLNDNYLDLAFKAVVECVEEAIINSLLYSQKVIGYNQKTVHSLLEYIELFDDLLIS